MASAVVLVKKQDGTFMVCVDYRRLNAVTKEIDPLTRIDDTLDRLRHARHFSSMGLKSGYWQIEVDERDHQKTSFVTPDVLYEFNVIPFGLCAAPATFQRVMDTVLAGLKWQSCLVYLDDLIVFSSNFDEPLRRLRAVLQVIKTAGLTLKTSKCRFAYDKLNFVGHVASNEGVRPDLDETRAVAALPSPTDNKAV